MSDATGRFNSYLNSHFRDQRLITQYTDEHRQRDCLVYDVGSSEVVGVSDGVDAWMLPRSGSIKGIPIATLCETNGDKSGNNEEDPLGTTTASLEPRPRTPTHKARERIWL